MAQFCTQCGKPLADGGICSCQAKKELETTTAQEMPVSVPETTVANLSAACATSAG